MINSEIKKMRMASGLSCTQVAEYLEVDLKVYLLMENENQMVNGEIIEKLCFLYGCNEKTLYFKESFTPCWMKDFTLKQLQHTATARKLYAQLR